MNKKLLFVVGGLALAAIVSVLIWNLAKSAGAQAKADASIEEGEGLLAQAAAKQGGAARDLCVKAMRKAEEALAAAPDHVPALLLLGRAQNALGDSAKACQAFDRLLSLEPEHPAGLREAGVAYFERWRISKDHAHRVEAEQDLQRALSFEPDSARALLYLGWLHHEAGEMEARDSIWSKLEKAAPDSAEARQADSIKSR